MQSWIPFTSPERNKELRFSSVSLCLCGEELTQCAWYGSVRTTVPVKLYEGMSPFM
jgi:hypothetical protein